MRAFLFTNDISADVAYPTLAQAAWGFPSTSTLVANNSTTRDVFVSFDGTTDHGVIRAGAAPIEWKNQSIDQLWLRVGAGAGAVVVDVTSENSGNH
jgi:hypothetical protein